MKITKILRSLHQLIPAMRAYGFGAFALVLMSSVTLSAQAPAGTDFLRSTGKIYVVAAVCLVILAALFIYLIQLDRRLSNLEKRLPNE